jgi:hypothetical protein
VDGYDVGYEWVTSRQRGDGNLQDWAPTILSQIRSKADALSKTPRFYVSITAATTICLENHEKLAKDLDYVNMQNYDGGLGCTPDVYFKAIRNLKPSKLVWGITAELPWKNDLVGSIDDAIKKSKEKYHTAVETGPLAGIMVWRLNSDNWVYENMLQVALYNKVHSKKSPDGLDDRVSNGWITGGQDKQDDGKPTSPWTEDDWIDAKQYRV